MSHYQHQQQQQQPGMPPAMMNVPMSMNNPSMMMMNPYMMHVQQPSYRPSRGRGYRPPYYNDSGRRAPYYGGGGGHVVRPPPPSRDTRIDILDISYEKYVEMYDAFKQARKEESEKQSGGGMRLMDEDEYVIMVQQHSMMTGQVFNAEIARQYYRQIKPTLLAQQQTS